MCGPEPRPRQKRLARVAVERDAAEFAVFLVDVLKVRTLDSEENSVTPLRLVNPSTRQAHK